MEPPCAVEPPAPNVCGEDSPLLPSEARLSNARGRGRCKSGVYPPRIDPPAPRSADAGVEVSVCVNWLVVEPRGTPVEMVAVRVRGTSLIREFLLRTECPGSDGEGTPGVWLNDHGERFTSDPVSGSSEGAALVKLDLVLGVVEYRVLEDARSAREGDLEKEKGDTGVGGRAVYQSPLTTISVVTVRQSVSEETYVAILPSHHPSKLPAQSRSDVSSFHRSPWKTRHPVQANLTPNG